MSTVSYNGTIVLFIANLLGKIFGAVYRLPLSNILGAEGMGLYQMAFPTYSFLLTFITGGVSIFLTRDIAKNRASNNNFEIYKNYKLGKNVCLILGIIGTFILLFFSYILSLLQGNIDANYGYIAISVGFVFSTMLGAFRGYYQGFGNMKPTAISQVLEQIFKLIFGLLFSYFLMQIDVKLGVFGALLGISISEFITFIYFIILNKKNVIPYKINLSLNDYKKFFKSILPVSISYMILPLSTLVDSFLVVNILKNSGYITSYATSLFGVETGMILPLINMPNVLISAIALTCIPNISYKLSNSENIKNDLQKLLKTTLILILPCCFGFYLLSQNIISTVYVNLNYNQLIIASQLLKFSAFEMFFLCFVTITNAIMQAINKTKNSIISLSMGFITKTILTVILISNQNLNIYGLVIASTIGYAVTSIYNLIILKQKFNIKLTLIEVFTPILACIIMTVFILSCFSLVGKTINFILLCIIISVCALIYFAVLILFKQLDLTELKNNLRLKRK